MCVIPSCLRACAALDRISAGGIYAPPTPGRMPARSPSLRVPDKLFAIYAKVVHLRYFLANLHCILNWCMHALMSSLINVVHMYQYFDRTVHFEGTVHRKFVVRELVMTL